MINVATKNVLVEKEVNTLLFLPGELQVRSSLLLQANKGNRRLPLARWTLKYFANTTSSPKELLFRPILLRTKRD